MRALMLLHVVFTRKGFVACRTQDIFLPGMFLPVACSVARSGERVITSITGRVGTRIFFFNRFRRWATRGGGCRGG